MHYRIAFGRSIEEMERDVNRLIKAGYEPHGDMTHIPPLNLLAQPMLKR